MRVLLSGYYGFGNLGDEALLEVIVAQIRTRLPKVEIDVLSAVPEDTVKRLSVSAKGLNVSATPRWNTREVRSAIERADVVLSGGGGLFQNATSLRSLLYYIGIVHQAVKMKRKTMIFAQSIGPLDVFGRFIVREGCKGVVRATVRDARSRALLESLLPKVPVEQTADPVFLYDIPMNDTTTNDATINDRDLSAEGLGPESEPYAIVSVRKVAAFNDGIATVARAVDRLYEQHGIRVAFLPLGGVEDAEISTAIIRKCATSPLLLPESSLARTAAMIRGAHLVIGMRLHALIFAARYGVPFVAIPYDPKVESLCTDFDYPLGPLWTPGRPAPKGEDVDTLIDGLVAQHDALSEHLCERTGSVRAAAARNFEILGELLH